MRPVTPGPRRQRGIATLLIVLLLGLAVAVTTLAVAHALRGAQQRHLTVHGATAAQGAAWRGVETLRLALLAAGQAQLAAWDGTPAGAAWSESCSGGGTPLHLNAGGLDGIGVRRAVLTRICRTATPQVYRVTAQVTGQAGADAKTGANAALNTATVEVVYEVGAIGPGPKPPGGDSPPLNAVITFNNNLKLSGSITVHKDPGAEYQINVKGDLDTDGNSITGVDTIWATGSIRITSGSSFGTLASNGDIWFDGSVSVTKAVNARGDICVSGGANAQNAALKANGSVIADGGVKLGDVSAIGKSDRGDQTKFCGAVQADADGNPYAVDLQGDSSAKSVAAAGSVRIGSGSIITANGLRASGHLVDTNCGGSESGVVGKTVSGPNDCNPPAWNGVAVQSGLQVPISPVSPVVLDAVKFNAYDVESAAHYAFKIDANGYKVVTVRNINGIDDGTYFIGDYDGADLNDYSRGYKDFLCKELKSSSTPSAPKCKAPLQPPAMTPCVGYSTSNNCISYDATSKKWTLSGNSFAPGIVWFEGNLQLHNGTYYNTFVATGNVSTTAGGVKVYAINYAGYDGKRGTKIYAPTGICVNSGFPNHYPTDYCDMANHVFVNPADSVIGHYALLAGSYGSAGSYVGGDIQLGASSKVFGSVLSGNLYSSGGSSTIHGSVTALSQGGATHAAGGSTTFDLRDLPSGFQPIVDPCKLTNACAGPPPAPGFGATVKWSRYL